MLNDLKRKTSTLLSRVYQLAAECRAIEVTELETSEPNLAEELDLLDKKIDALQAEINEVSNIREGGHSGTSSQADVIRLINKIIDEAELIDSLILAMPRPKSKVGKPKYYERIGAISAKIDCIVQEVDQIISPENSSQNRKRWPGTPH